MKIYLKRDSSDIYSRYLVLDEFGNQKYSIVGKHSASGERMYIMQGDTRLAKMRDTHLGVLRSYYVSTHDETTHIVITRKGTDIAITYHGISWHIRGDVLLKSYDIMDVDNSVVAVVSQSFSTVEQSFEINIYNEKKELFCIASAVCIDSIASTLKPAMQML